jgi:modulator of FtsH protease HflC
MRRLILFLLIAGGLFVGIVAAGNLGIPPAVITREGEQNLILRFSQVQRVTEPGLSWAIPFVDEVRPYDSRWLYNSTDARDIQTKDGEQLRIDNYTVWRIDDPRAFLEAFPGQLHAAEQRIDRVVRDSVREVIGRHTLAEVLKDQRVAIMESITKKSRDALADFGIEVQDVRINRTELPARAEDSVYARMATERERLAKKNRARGEEQARGIRAAADREARVIVANARRDAEITRGEGDAEAARIYAEAYDADRDFYGFVRSLEAYRKTIDDKTTIVLSPHAEFFRYLEGAGAKETR